MKELLFLAYHLFIGIIALLAGIWAINGGRKGWWKFWEKENQ